MLRVISILGRYLIGPKAGVESVDFFLCFNFGLPRRDILAGDDPLTDRNIGLALDANAEK